jgi:DNA-directed RNA polymerase alpha subunit
MKIKNFKITKNEIEFETEKVPISYINGLRRTLISEMDVHAIHYMKLDENTTNLPDDFLAHRIGMIPIQNKTSGFTPSLFLEETNNTDTILHIFSDHLKNEQSNYIIPPKIFLFSLQPNQSIKMECFVVVGKGKKHSKWSSVSGTRIANLNEEDNKYSFCTEICENYNVHSILLDAVSILKKDLINFQKENKFIL